MLGLYASGIGFLGALGVAAAIGVAVGALGALTLVPALLGLAGRRIDRLRVRRPAAEASASHAGWARYAATVGAHPWRFLLAGVLFLGVLAIPLLSLQLGHVDAGADPASYSDKQAYDAISSGFGPGANGPFTVVIQPGHGASRAQVQQLAGTLHTDLAAAPGRGRGRARSSRARTGPSWSPRWCPARGRRTRPPARCCARCATRRCRTRWPGPAPAAT